MKIGFNLFLLIVFVLHPSSVFAGREFNRSSTTKDVVELNAPKDAPRHQFFIGGGVNFIYVDSDIGDDEVGGAVVTRYTYLDTISLQKQADFTNYSVDEKGFDGDVFGIPTLFTLLLHSPWWKNMRLYVIGGIGKQFNDSDLEVDVGVSGIDGLLIVPPDDATVLLASDTKILADAKVTTFSGIIVPTVKTESAKAAAEADAALAAEALTFALATKEVPLEFIDVPPGTIVDVDVDDGYVWTVGGGIDVKVTEDMLLNFEARYQCTHFDFSGKLDVPGLGVFKIDDEETFYTWVFRAGVLIRL